MSTVRGLNIPESLEDLCRPDRMALIVYDMQIGVVRQVSDGAEITRSVAEVLDAARSGGFRVVFMRHMSMPLELMGVYQYRQAMAWQRTKDPSKVKPWFLPGSPGFDIVSELAPRPNEAVLDKITFSAFEGTPLAIVLRDCGLTAFAICGVATEIGIEPTVRHGADLGLIPVVVKDACSGGHPEAAERAMASLAFMGDAMITDRKTLIDSMNSQG